MARRSFTSSRSFRTATPFYLALLLLVLSLLVFFAGGWAFYSLFRYAKEDELSRRLEAIALAAEPLIAEKGDFALRALRDSGSLPQTDAEWVRWFETLRAVYEDKFALLESQMRALRESVRLKEVLLISPQKRVICAVPGPLTAGASAPLVNIDRQAWESALKGVAQDVPYYEYAGVPYNRVYVPVRVLPSRGLAAGGGVAAVLRVEAGLETYGEIAHLRTQGLILAVIVTVLMGTVAFLFYRLIRLFARIEESAAHRDRLEAMGTLVAGIAHEIRNPLGIIRALAEGMRGDLAPGDQRREMLTDILDEVARLSGLVTQYLTFARPAAGGSEDAAHPDDIARSLAAIFEKGEEGQSRRIALDSSGDIPAVRMGTGALRQVLINLLINARDASSPDSAINVRCGVLRGGTQVEIRVSDCGHGISPRDLRRIFDPFFTTKTGGSGLGLSICRRLVEECGGAITVESEPGKGTTVQVMLPVAGK